MRAHKALRLERIALTFKAWAATRACRTIVSLRWRMAGAKAEDFPPLEDGLPSHGCREKMPQTREVPLVHEFLARVLSPVPVAYDTILASAIRAGFTEDVLQRGYIWVRKNELLPVLATFPHGRANGVFWSVRATA